MAVTFAWVGLMQLFEYVMWTHLTDCADRRAISWNRVATCAAIVVNHTEPLIMYAAVRAFVKKKLPAWLDAAAAAFALTAAAFTVACWPTNAADACTSASDGSPHLHWRWNYYGGGADAFYAIFIVFFVAVAYVGLQPPVNAIIPFVAVATFGWSYLVYRKSRAVGAVWCVLGAFVPLAYAVYFSVFPV